MSPELCGCGLRGERDRARAGAAVSCALRRRTPTVESVLTADTLAAGDCGAEWTRARRSTCAVPRAWRWRRFDVSSRSVSGERSDTTFRLVITPPPRPRGRGTNGGITSSLNARETGGAITRTGWAIPKVTCETFYTRVRLRAGVVMNHRGKTRERPGHRGLISTRVPSKCPLVRPRQ